jgi:hypothetical protein
MLRAMRAIVGGAEVLSLPGTGACMLLPCISLPCPHYRHPLPCHRLDCGLLHRPVLLQSSSVCGHRLLFFEGHHRTSPADLGQRLPQCYSGVKALRDVHVVSCAVGVRYSNAQKWVGSAGQSLAMLECSVLVPLDRGGMVWSCGHSCWPPGSSVLLYEDGGLGGMLVGFCVSLTMAMQ